MSDRHVPLRPPSSGLRQQQRFRPRGRIKKLNQPVTNGTFFFVSNPYFDSIATR